MELFKKQLLLELSKLLKINKDVTLANSLISNFVLNSMNVIFVPLPHNADGVRLLTDVYLEP